MFGKVRTYYLVAALGATVAGYVLWQFIHFRNTISSIQADPAREILVGALSTRVLAPGVDAEESESDRQEPILDQSRKNPNALHRRYLLVTTWLHASQMFEAMQKGQEMAAGMVNSASLTSVSQEERIDGWGNPYCVLADPSRITFLSSGGLGSLDCEGLRHLAKQESLSAKDARLKKAGSLLVVVIPKTKDTLPATDH